METLESLANHNERENEEIIGLRKTVERLENEKQAKQQDRLKFEMELEAVEENYRKEIDDLWSMVKSLQNENKHLSSSVSPETLSPASMIQMNFSCFTLIYELRSLQVFQLVDTRKSMRLHISYFTEGYMKESFGGGRTHRLLLYMLVCILESLFSAPRDEDLTVMIELRELSNKQKEQIKELQRDIETYSCEVENLHNSIEKLIRQNEELLRKNASLQKQGRMLVEEKSEIIKRLQQTEEANFKLTKLFKDASRQCKDLQQSQQEDNDNAPRFTLAELREVLQEKNLLKGKVLELEEELEQLRPSRRPGSAGSDANQELENK
ncbi:unnamed protein product [Toxocara canis]|uniref:RH2 domain-containing protein n=1 Tax=Toxocara canis TaxID=6265 RepID=A0A3P7H013_TOXCA|nr:unnamed protein product [Toxocara canis]